MTSSTVKLTIAIDPTLDDEERELTIRQLYRQLDKLDEVETLDRISNLDFPYASESIGQPKLAVSTIIGVLTADISKSSVLQVLKLVGRQIGGHKIEVDVEYNGKKIKLVVDHRDDFDTTIQGVRALMAEGDRAPVDQDLGGAVSAGDRDQATLPSTPVLSSDHSQPHSIWEKPCEKSPS